MVLPQQSPPAPSTATEEEILDRPLHEFGFQYHELSPNKVSGHLQVTPKCCQPFKVLHGGVSALMAESMASMGACLACGAGRVAGIQLSINHFKSAQLGDVVYAEATPVSSGKTIQVWEVRFWKRDSKIPEKRILTSSSRVTIMCNMPVAENQKDALKKFKKYAKL